MSMKPEGWSTIKLGEVVEITSSKRVYLSDYVEEGVPFYRSKEIIQRFQRQSISTELFITEDKYNYIEKRFGAPKEGDLLVTSVGTLGIPLMVTKSDRFYFKDGNLTWFRNYDTDRIYPKYLYFWFQSTVGKQAIEQSKIGSTQQAITIIALKNIQITLPPISQQIRIASLFSSLDDKIELNLQMNKTLEAIAQAIFKEWFVDFRFPGFEGELVDGLPKGWEKGKLSDIANIAIGRTPPRNEHKWFSKNPENIKWISIKDMGTSGVYITDTSEYLTPEAKTTFRIPEISENTLVLSFKLTVGRISITTEKMLSNEAIAQIRSTFGVEFLYCYLANYRFDSLGSTSSIATAINSRTIKEMPVLIPDHSVVTQFCAMVRPIFDRIRLNSHEVMTVENIRNELLPKLMTGKIRVA